MPTTSSPWASPSSPAGRRLLQSEPATADGIPVLDEAALALGAALVAAASAPLPAPVVVDPIAASSRRRTPFGIAPVVARGRRGLVAAGLAMALLVVGTTAGLDRPAPAASGPVPDEPQALGRAAGSALGAGPSSVPLPDGQVVVGLIDPTEAVGATPGAPVATPLAPRLGHLVALAAEDAPAR